VFFVDFPSELNMIINEVLAIVNRNKGRNSYWTEECELSTGAYIHPGSMMHFPSVSDSPVSEKIFRLWKIVLILPFLKKILIFIRQNFWWPFFSHRLQICNFSSHFRSFSTFPPISEKLLFPLLLQISPLISLNLRAFYILSVFFVPPTLTITYLCITQCTYLTPLINN